MAAHMHGGVMTTGRVLHTGRLYDLGVHLCLLGQAPALRAQTVRLAGIQPGDAVLDVGCGTGELTLRAAQAAGPDGRVEGIDPSPEMIAVAQAKAARAGGVVRFTRAAIEDLPFADGTFDVVVSSLMMHHLPDDLQQRGLAEVYRVLRPGGTLLITDFRRPESRPGRVFMHLLRHGGGHTGVQDLLPRLRAAGFARTGRTRRRFGPLGYVRAEKGVAP